MPQQADFFRDYGILPSHSRPNAYPIRAFYPWHHVIGQYLGTLLLAGIGIGLAALFVFFGDFPTNVLAPPVAIAVTCYFLYRATRFDYSWVELNGSVVQAQHLYTRRVVAHSVNDINDLLTVVFLARKLEIRIAEAWLGRVRGVMVRFRNTNNSILICRADPSMKNAKELIEAIIFEMSQLAAIDFEIIDFEGKPMVRRIHWK